LRLCQSPIARTKSSHRQMWRWLGSQWSGWRLATIGLSPQRHPTLRTILGQEIKKRGSAKPGDTVALARLDKIATGETISAERGGINQIKGPVIPEPVYGLAIGLKDRKDEVKLTTALAKLIVEDPSLRLDHAKETHQLVL